ncbi:MAG TPA: VanW family protein [Armatimonadota bacterium]|nr:VanW family protein [Armatimonadota bacterium]
MGALRRVQRAVQLVAALGVAGGALALVAWCPRPIVLASYATRLEGRSASQIHNAALAARSLDGQVIGPGDAFSFGATVGPWTADMGFDKAPVSYEGELVLAYGGGVCQTSTTFYNAALAGGLEILERHPHQWPPKYVAPGRDAAVAYGEVDLRVRNPYDFPITIRAATDRQSVHVSLLADRRPPFRVRVVQSIRGVDAPSVVIHYDARYARGVRRTDVAGRPGIQVTTSREFIEGDRVVRRELVSHDRYEPVNTVMGIGTGPTGIPVR